MFGGIGGALNSLKDKAGEMMEKTKKSVEELAAEKKAAAQAMLEGQGKKTTDSLLQTKGEIEKTATQAAIDGFDKEVTSTDKVIDSTVTDKKEDTPQPSSLPIDPSKLAAVALGGTGEIDKQVEKAVDGAIQQVGITVDAKLKETDQYIDEKREQVVQQVQVEATKATESTSQGVGAILGKAKGFLNF